MGRNNILLAALFSTGLGACAFPASTPGDRVSFEQLIRQLKFDIGTYIVAHQADVPVVAAPGPNGDAQSRKTYQSNKSAGRARPPKAAEKCLGQVSFDIAKIKITVATEVENTASSEAGLSVPLSVGSTLGLSASGSIGRAGSLTTVLEIYPASQTVSSTPKSVPEFEGTPITSSLDALRADLIRTADTEPCFDFGRSTDQANTVTWGFKVVRSGKVGGKFTIELFSLGGDVSGKETITNTIQVSYTATGGFD